MAMTRAAEVKGRAAADAKQTTPTAGVGSADVRRPPVPSMRVPKLQPSNAANDTSPLPTAAERDTQRADLDAAQEWALRAKETQARIDAAEERAWKAQLEKAKAAAEEDEWRLLRERAAEAEQRDWEALLAKARANAVATPSAAKPPRPVRPARTSRSSTPTPARASGGAAPTSSAESRTKPSTPVVSAPPAAAAPQVAVASSPAVPPPESPSASSFAPFGHVAQHTPAPAKPRVISWP